MYSGSKMEPYHGTNIEAHSAPKMEAQSWRSSDQMYFCKSCQEYENLTPKKTKYEHTIQKAHSWHKCCRPG